MFRAGEPARLGGYRVVRELGRGGMGLVYEAVHARLGKRVAIKVLRPHLLESPGSVERFVREGRAACRVVHPNVVAVHELGEHAGTPYLVMDLLEGEHLGEQLERTGPLPLSQLCDLMAPIIAAVSAAHAAGVVHRDLKPSNIMLARGYDGAIVPKVLDFGTSKLSSAHAEQALTLTGAVLGTLHYMPPEQVHAPSDADAYSDQYALGAILYECATGMRPFAGDGYYELMQAIMTAPLVPPRELAPTLPAAFDETIRRAMRRRPRERFPSVASFGREVLHFASEPTRRAVAVELDRAIAYELQSPRAAPAAPARECDGSAQLATGSSTQPDPSRLFLAGQRLRAQAPSRTVVGLAVAAVLALTSWMWAVERDVREANLATPRARGMQKVRGHVESRQSEAPPLAPVRVQGSRPAPAATSLLSRNAEAVEPAGTGAPWVLGAVPGDLRQPQEMSAVLEPGPRPRLGPMPRPTSGLKPATEGETDSPRDASIRSRRPRAPRTKPPAERRTSAEPVGTVELGDNDAPIIE